METIYLVDDDPPVRKSLARMLREEGCTVETFESAEAYLARPDATSEGCLVLDVTMPGLDGLALQRRLFDQGQTLPIVFLTGHGDIPMAVQAIKAGAADFLTKPVSADALMTAVRAAIAEGASTRRAADDIAASKQKLASLTAREREVFAAIVRGRLNKQIAGDLGIVEKTVKFHRAKIMERMQVHTVAQLVHVAARLSIEAARD